MLAGRAQINVLIAMNNRIISQGVKRLVAENDGNRAFCLDEREHDCCPDIILCDASYDLKALRKIHPEGKIIIFDIGLEDQEIARLLAWYDIKGIISPEADVAMFQKAIRLVSQGEIWIDQKHLRALLESNNHLSETGEIRQLSHQDKKIVKLICQGYRNREIGARLCLSEHTIKTHVSRIYKLLHVSNRVQLVSQVKEFVTDL